MDTISQFLPIVILLGLGFILFEVIVSAFVGAPFVPTQNKFLDKIFDDIQITPKDIFYDLGCGEGRVIAYVAKKYGAKSIGVEYSPLLTFANKLRWRGKNIQFLRQNIFNTNISNATVIYLYLFPKLLEKLAPKIIEECEAGTTIISHKFRITKLEKYLTKTNEKDSHLTYYYKLT